MHLGRPELPVVAFLLEPGELRLQKDYVGLPDRSRHLWFGPFCVPMTQLEKLALEPDEVRVGVLPPACLVEAGRGGIFAMKAVAGVAESLKERCRNLTPLH